MFYEYVGLNCPCAEVTDNADRIAVCEHTIQLPVAKCQAMGKTRACPVKGCTGRVTRVLSSDTSFIVRGNTQIDWNPGESVRTVVNGEEMKFKFVDHPHTDPKLQNRFADVSKRAGVKEGNGIGKAYFSEKHGKMCVDVASTHKDPLGAIERQARRIHDTRRINLRFGYGRDSSFLVSISLGRRSDGWHRFDYQGRFRLTCLIR